MDYRSNASMVREDSVCKSKFAFLELSNDPDKNYSIFYCSAAILFPHIETVVLSDQEFINR